MTVSPVLADWLAYPPALGGVSSVIVRPMSRSVIWLSASVTRTLTSVGPTVAPQAAAMSA